MLGTHYGTFSISTDYSGMQKSHYLHYYAGFSTKSVFGGFTYVIRGVCPLHLYGNLFSKHCCTEIIK